MAVPAGDAVLKRARHSDSQPAIPLLNFFEFMSVFAPFFLPIHSDSQACTNIGHCAVRVGVLQSKNRGCAYGFFLCHGEVL